MPYIVIKVNYMAVKWAGQTLRRSGSEASASHREPPSRRAQALPGLKLKIALDHLDITVRQGRNDTAPIRDIRDPSGVFAQHFSLEKRKSREKQVTPKLRRRIHGQCTGRRRANPVHRLTTHQFEGVRHRCVRLKFTRLPGGASQ